MTKEDMIIIFMRIYKKQRGYKGKIMNNEICSIVPPSPYRSVPVSLPVSPCTLVVSTRPAPARPRLEGRAAAKNVCNYDVINEVGNGF